MNASDMLELAAQLGLSDYDVLIVADGSGSRPQDACGWSFVMFDRARGEVYKHVGGATCGTNNYAELAPFCQALWLYHRLREGDIVGSISVHCVSDSEVTVRCGNGLYGRQANTSLWAAINWFGENGYRLTWHHVARNSNPINRHCDERSRKTRLRLE